MLDGVIDPPEVVISDVVDIEAEDCKAGAVISVIGSVVDGPCVVEIAVGDVVGDIKSVKGGTLADDDNVGAAVCGILLSWELSTTLGFETASVCEVLIVGSMKVEVLLSVVPVLEVIILVVISAGAI